MIRDFETEEFLDIKHNQVADVIKQYGPYRFFVTLTFQRPVDDASALRHGEVFVGRLHKQLFGRYGWRSVRPLTGVVLLEREDIKKKRRYPGLQTGVELLAPVDVGKILWVRDRGNCHFHFLLRDHPALERRPVKALRRFQQAARKAGTSLNYSETEKLVSKNGVYVSLAPDKGAINYVSKESRYLSWWSEERLFFIHRSQEGEFDLVPGAVPLKRWWNMPTI
ncbi:hypothetical protein [Dyella japonica]|uniref:Uncharacterized protein n=1 Tax=Dyella japonica TaxID=231455 RepID=A0ABV2JZK8_9GAMM